jgi:hypothetical protein
MFIYPHALDSWQNYDLGGEPCKKIRCNFVASPESKRILEFLKYPCPVEVIGFPFYPKVHDLTPSTGKSILFAPNHSVKGTMHPDLQKGNLDVQGFLTTLMKDYSITIYLHHSMMITGIPGVPGINYSYSDLSIKNAIQMIKQHDIIIARGTFLQLAVAMGKPAISFMENFAYRPWKYPDRTMDHPLLMENWKYPIDLYNYSDPNQVLVDCQNSDIISTWKKEVLGDSFNPLKFVNIMRKYL